MEAELLRQLWHGFMAEGLPARVGLGAWSDPNDPASMLMAYTHAYPLEQKGLLRLVDHRTVAPTADGLRAAEDRELIDGTAVAIARRLRSLGLQWVEAADGHSGVSYDAIGDVTGLSPADVRAALDFWLLDGCVTRQPAQSVRLTERGRERCADLWTEPSDCHG